MSLAAIAGGYEHEHMADPKCATLCSPSLVLKGRLVEGDNSVNQPASAMPSVIHPGDKTGAASAGRNRRFPLLP